MKYYLHRNTVTGHLLWTIGFYQTENDIEVSKWQYRFLRFVGFLGIKRTISR